MGTCRAALDKEDDDSSRQRFYDVDRFKQIIDAHNSAPPPTFFRKILLRIGIGIDSIAGLISTFLGMVTIFAAPLVVVIGAMFGLFGFLVSFFGVIGLLGFYVERKLGDSIQVVDTSILRKVIPQVLGSALVLAAFYIIFVVILGYKLT